MAMSAVNCSFKHDAATKCLIKEITTPVIIRERAENTYGDSTPSYETVKRWTTLLEQGAVSLEHDPRHHWPSDIITWEINRRGKGAA